MIQTSDAPDISIDLSAGQRLRGLALALFDSAAPVHRLPNAARRLLQFAAAYYVAGRQIDPTRPNRVGRDLALTYPLAGFSADDQALIACAVALQRDKVRPQREPVFLRLGSKDQAAALRLAAILQVAIGLDERPTAGLRAVETSEEQTTLLLGGSDEEASVGLSDSLWRETLGRLVARTGDVLPVDGAAQSLAMPSAEGWDALIEIPYPPTPHGQFALLSGGEPIAEGSRRVLRRFFDRLLAREDGVRKGEDDEDVHQMRVATRRLRASLQVVEPIYEPDLVRRYRRGLRRIAESLGAVRDWDVFLQHVAGYRDGSSAGQRAGVQPLLDAISGQRADARARLLDDLERSGYRKLKRAFATFLTTPGMGLAEQLEHGADLRVRDFAGSAIWRRYEQWRAYEVALARPSDETLHQARIAGKRLRYTLEFFADALGPQVEQILAPLVALQDNLGNLQDSVVARQRVHAFGLDGHAAIEEYLRARDAERAAHLAELPRLWEQVAGDDYRRWLFELIVKL